MSRPVVASVAAPPGLQRELITPEGVDLRIELASASQRAGAFLIDCCLMLAVLIALTIGCFLVVIPLLGRPNGMAVVGVIWLLGSFLLRNAWFLAFEFGARAASPGKRAMGIRVVSRSGGRLTADAIVARNAMREIEIFLPLTFLGMEARGMDSWIMLLGLLWSGIFCFFPLFNRDRLRVGDLVAGTWVVQRPQRKMVADLTEALPDAGPVFVFSAAQLDAYGVKELQVLEEVLRGRKRETLRTVAERIRRKIGWVARHDETDAGFLEAYYAALRGRLEARLLLGRRRKDKFDAA